MVRSTQFQATPQIVNALAQRLESALPKQTGTGLQIVIQLLPQIEDFLEKGYSLTDVHALFEDEGLDCSYETFRRYFHKAKRLRDRQSPAPSFAQATAVESELVGMIEVALQPNPTIAATKAAPDPANQSSAIAVVPSTPALIHPDSSDQVAEPSRSRQSQKSTHRRRTSNKQSIPSQASPTPTAEAPTPTAEAKSKTKASPTDIVIPDGHPPPDRQELESHFSVLGTPRKTKAEKAKHFNQY